MLEAPGTNDLQDSKGSMWLCPSHALEVLKEAVVPSLYLLHVLHDVGAVIAGVAGGVAFRASMLTTVR